jgi:cell division protein FtsB
MALRKAEDRLIVVKHKPGIKLKRRVIFFIGVLIVGVLCFLLGNAQIKNQHERVVQELGSMSTDYAALKETEIALRQKVANLEGGRAIDDFAKQEIQETIRDYKTRISQLEKDVSFYQNIMAPSDNARGLKVQTVDIAKGTIDRQFDYKIVLAQVADNKNYVSGVVAVNLIGMQDEQEKVLALRDISEQQTALGIKFRFKYFQDITGSFVIPEGFTPSSIQVVAQSKGKKASRLEQNFEWLQLIDQKS